MQKLLLSIRDSMTWYRIKRSILFFLQRRVRGFDDSETWTLDYSLAKLISPRLKRFKELKRGVPLFDNIDVDKDYDLAEAQWEEIIDKMIAAFDLIIVDDGSLFFDEEQQKKVEEGLDLFRKYIFNLWW